MDKKQVFHWLVISIVLTLAVSCGTLKPVAKPATKQVQSRETRINNKYVLESPFGHKLEVEMDYTVGQTGYINNGCRAQYILSNVGNMPIDGSEEFLNGKGTIINSIKFDSTYRIGNIVFEFSTSDGKKIEHSEGIVSGGSTILPSGKSYEAKGVSINAGDRFCISIKPIRIEMYRGLRVGNNKKK